jgi:hypothetical protein
MQVGNWRVAAMDTIVLTTLAMSILKNFVPFLAKAEEAVANKAGEAVFEQGKRIYEAIRTRFAKEADGGKTNKVLENFTDDPEEYAPNLQNKLLSLLRADPDFANTLTQIIQAGPVQSIEIGDDSVAESNQMRNRKGQGSQTMHGKDRTQFKNNIMEIN